MNKVIKLENGKFGIINTAQTDKIFSEKTGKFLRNEPAWVASGMEKSDAEKLADRLNLRLAWGE